MRSNSSSATMVAVLIRVEGFDFPGRSCGPGPDFPDGHHNIHVAVQGREGQRDLLGMVPADVTSVTWDLESDLVAPPPRADLRGPHIHGPPGKRFVYITWGVVTPSDSFRMFRRAKLWLDAVPGDVMQAVRPDGILVGRLGLTDDKGWPLCAAVRPPRIHWSAN
jgi:Family of unknown function (DUF5990)